MYTDDVPEITLETGVTTEFDTDSNKWQVKIVGTGFGTDDDAQLFVKVGTTAEWVEQTRQSQTNTMLVFDVDNVEDLVTGPDNVKLYFPVGLPKNHEELENGFILTPKVMSVTPNEGSSGGMRITVSVPGIGKNTADMTLVDPNGSDICRTDIEVPEYGVIYCWTRHEEVADYQQVRL